MNNNINIFHVTIEGVYLTCAEINGVKLCSTAPHPVTFGDENCIFGDVPPSGMAVSAKPTASPAGEFGGASLQTLSFKGDPKYYAILEGLKKKGIVAFGSVIAMTAYPGLVYGLVPVEGFERVSLKYKRAQANLFNIS